jgi:hypothetical protein
MPAQPFSRIGQPVRVPVSATSASNEFVVTRSMMPGIADLTFMFVNPNPFDVRLEGMPADTAFSPVTATTGWLVLARQSLGPFTSKNPARLSAQAFGTPGMPLPEGFDYSNCVIELIYGRGV